MSLTLSGRYSGSLAYSSHPSADECQLRLNNDIRAVNRKDNDVTFFVDIRCIDI